MTEPNERPSNAVCGTVEIVNMRGLHARASRKFAETAQKFQGPIIVRYDGESADGRSIMELMMLGAGPGAQIEIEAHGADGDQAFSALASLVSGRFGEDE